MDVTTCTCEPDFNAWTKQINPRPLASDWQLRSAGGHIHIGTKEDPIEVIRAMDLFVGVPSIIKDPGGERRRELYGMPGAYRIKPFGCEYRVLSNFWIFSRELVEWVYNQTAKAIDFVESGETIDPEVTKNTVLTAKGFNTISTRHTIEFSTTFTTGIFDDTRNTYK